MGTGPRQRVEERPGGTAHVFGIRADRAGPVEHEHHVDPAALWEGGVRGGRRDLEGVRHHLLGAPRTLAAVSAPGRETGAVVAGLPRRGDVEPDGLLAGGVAGVRALLCVAAEPPLGPAPLETPAVASHPGRQHAPRRTGGTIRLAIDGGIADRQLGRGRTRPRRKRADDADYGESPAAPASDGRHRGASLPQRSGPVTCGVTACTNTWYAPLCVRADAGTRTPDPLLTMEVLYQLSYVGMCCDGGSRIRTCVG